MPVASCRVGALTVLSLSDGTGAVAPEDFFPAVPDTAWRTDDDTYLRADGQFELNFGCFLIGEAANWTLVDTGYGARPGSYGGRLLSELAGAGVRPEEITRVIITHLHADHAGGAAVDRDGRAVPVFPRARHLLQRRDWDARSVLEQGFPDLHRCMDPIAEVGLLELIDGDVRVTPA